MSTRSYSNTPRHDARHCGHVSRSESRTIKTAAVWFEVLAEEPEFPLPVLPPAVLAVLDAMRAGVACADLGAIAVVQEWFDDALDAQTVDGFVALPATPAAAGAYAGTKAAPCGLEFLLPLLAR